MFSNLLSYNRKWRCLHFGGCTCAGGISSRLLPVRRPHGHFRLAHSASSLCGSVCSCLSLPAMPKRGATSLHSSRRCESRNLAVETRFAEELNRLPNLAMELVTAKVDVLVTEGTQTSQAARKATSNIPVVMARIGDAVGAGLVSTLAHPGSLGTFSEPTGGHATPNWTMSALPPKEDLRPLFRRIAGRRDGMTLGSTVLFQDGPMETRRCALYARL